MMGIFGFFGSILGYLLWGLFYIFQNFGVSIILFTIVVKIIMFPFSVKQQKSMANTMRLQKKQREIQKKYADNRVKMNEEMQKLYQKEGVSPGGGCLTSIVPFILMLGIFYSVAYPLTNTLHLSEGSVKSAISYVQTIPGYSVLSEVAAGGGVYQEINLVRIISEIESNIASTDKSVIDMMFSGNDAVNPKMFVDGFDFAGFNLLTIPNTQGIFSIYFLIPVKVEFLPSICRLPS